MASNHNELILESQETVWGWAYETLLEQLEAYHQEMHPNDKRVAEWCVSTNGEFRSTCGLKVNVLQALRVAGAMRN